MVRTLTKESLKRSHASLKVSFGGGCVGKKSSHVRIDLGGSLSNQSRASPSREKGKSKSFIEVFRTSGCLNVEVTLFKNRRNVYLRKGRKTKPKQQNQAPPPVVEPFNLEEPIENPDPLAPMDDTRTMAQLLEAPTAGYEDAIVVPEITADNFELKPKSKVRNSRNKPVVAKVSSSTSTPGISSDVAELKDMVKALLLDKKNQSPAPTPIKAVEESCVTCGGAHSYQTCPATTGNVYRDNIQEYVSQAAAANYNQGNTGYRAPISNQIRPPGFPPIQNNHNVQNQGNNQNRYNQNRGNFNQASAYQPPVQQGQIYRHSSDQTPVYQRSRQSSSSSSYSRCIERKIVQA
ncbi:hypothetical protein Tco_0992846 [Tanacetum coccineum]|uniref:Reverse transcriptase domain-containing protein n=1 Tax=Tanacetum coccineum TaxID=301880 RepID=A0ABQ5F519_9ASTR